MKNNFVTTIVVDQSPAEVFESINNVRGWWQGKIEGETDKLYGVFTYQMMDMHFSKQKITSFIPEKKVAWLVTESNLNFVSKKDEWTGTTIIFEINELPASTELLFTHEGIDHDHECYDICSVAWTQLIQKSLFQLITTGKGVDVF